MVHRLRTETAGYNLVPMWIHVSSSSSSFIDPALSRPALLTRLIGCKVFSSTGARLTCRYRPSRSLISMSWPVSSPASSSSRSHEGIGGKLSLTCAGRLPVPTPTSPTLLSLTAADGLGFVMRPSSASSNAMSSLTNPIFGLMPLRRSRTNWYARASGQWWLWIRYAITAVTLRDLPALQCTYVGAL